MVRFQEQPTTALKMTVDAVPEILPQPEQRRPSTSEQKLGWLLRCCWGSPMQIARRYGISTGLSYTSRRLARNGELSRVLLARLAQRDDRAPGVKVFLACDRPVCAKAWTAGDAGPAELFSGHVFCCDVAAGTCPMMHDRRESLRLAAEPRHLGQHSARRRLASRW